MLLGGIGWADGGDREAEEAWATGNRQPQNNKLIPIYKSMQRSGRNSSLNEPTPHPFTMASSCKGELGFTMLLTIATVFGTHTSILMAYSSF